MPAMKLSRENPVAGMAGLDSLGQADTVSATSL